MNDSKKKFIRRRDRVRRTLKNKASGRLRLSVHKTGSHIYAQLIDDKNGRTLVSASTLEKDLAKKLKSTSSIEAATKVGEALALRALEKVDNQALNVMFDRGGNAYLGKIKALADAAREKGLKF